MIKYFYKNDNISISIDNIHQELDKRLKSIQPLNYLIKNYIISSYNKFN